MSHSDDPHHTIFISNRVSPWRRPLSSFKLKSQGWARRPTSSRRRFQDAWPFPQSTVTVSLTLARYRNSSVSFFILQTPHTRRPPRWNAQTSHSVLPPAPPCAGKLKEHLLDKNIYKKRYNFIHSFLSYHLTQHSYLKSNPAVRAQHPNKYKYPELSNAARTGSHDYRYDADMRRVTGRKLRVRMDLFRFWGRVLVL